MTNVFVIVQVIWANINIQRLISFFIVISFLLVSSSISASIGGAKPEYNYDEFLITSFPRDEYSHQAFGKHRTVRTNVFRQTYKVGNYGSTRFLRADSLFTVDMEGVYCYTLYKGSFYVASPNHHQLSITHLDYPHKQSFKLSNFILQNSFNIINRRNWGSLRANNAIIYAYDHSDNDDVDLSYFTLHTGIQKYKGNRLTEVNATLPVYNNAKTYRIAAKYYYNTSERPSRVTEYRSNSHLFMAGLTAIRNSTNDNVSIFPTLTYRYNYYKDLLTSLSLEEQLQEYPFNNYFYGSGLLWRSHDILSDDELSPISVKKLTSVIESNIGKVNQRLEVSLSQSDQSYLYDWQHNGDKSSYVIILSNEKKQSATISYSLNYKLTNLSITSNLLDRTDFEPLLIIDSGTKINLSLFHSVSLGTTYNHEEKIVNGNQKLNYGLINLSYHYTNLKYFGLQAGINYSTLDTKTIEWKDSPTIFLTLLFGAQ